MRYSMPSPVLISGTYHLRVRTPSDVAKAAKGTTIVAPVAGAFVTVRVGEHVKIPLRTKDIAEAKRRFPHALAAVEAHWEALRNGPVTLSHRQCVALAGELRQVWIEILDENPGDPRLWGRAQELDAQALQAPQDGLKVGVEDAKDTQNSLERRFGGLTDATLRRRGLNVDGATRKRLLPLVASVMGEVAEVNLKKAKGDYSDSGETKKYPEYEPAGTPETNHAKQATRSLSFASIIEEEDRRRSLGKDGKPLPRKTLRKYISTAKEFTEYRGSDEAMSVTPDQVEGWKLELLERGKLSNSTIAQRMQNLSTVLEWGQEHTLGKLFLNKNPAQVPGRPERRGVRSEDRTLRLSEARAILKAARMETKPTLRWLPWMMAYSGARVGELAQLLPKDFFELENRWFYVLTNKGRKTLKNEHSIRKVPIHPDLITEGLLEFVAERGNHPEERLFMRTSQNIVAEWVRDVVGVTREEAAPNHGWRHLFEDMALDAGMSASAKLYITGRASGDSADGYGKSDAMLPALSREMSKIKSYL